MNNENVGLFMGKPPSYWIELQVQAESLKAVTLIEEIAILRSKVSFYEARLDQMNEFRKCDLFK